MATKYTIRYRYGTYSGIRIVWMEDEEEERWTAIEKMWSQMRQRRELTLGLAYQSAEIISREEESSEDEE